MVRRIGIVHVVRILMNRGRKGAGAASTNKLTPVRRVLERSRPSPCTGSLSRVLIGPVLGPVRRDRPPELDHFSTRSTTPIQQWIPLKCRLEAQLTRSTGG